jgi:uncharacterized protein (TIGR03790 family)
MRNRDVTSLRCWAFIRAASGAILLVAALPSGLAEAPAKRSPDEVLLVSNENSHVSQAVADDYAQMRHITHRLGIHCADSAARTTNETISLDEYRSAIETPVSAYLETHPGIQFIVLTKGVPLRISGAETGERPVDSSPNTPLRTSVDSHLAALGYSAIPDARQIRITGSGATGKGWLNRYWGAHELFSHEKFGGYLVTRLDGYTESDARALVRRALEAEAHRPMGKVLLDAQPIFGLGDKDQVPKQVEGDSIPDESPWREYNGDMQRAYDFLQQRGLRAELDLKEEFVGSRNDLTGYFSWGSNDARFSKRAYASLMFGPGSIGDTAVSTSGRTFLPTQGGQSLIVDLVAHGLTCAKGYVDEPLLQANASPSMLLDLYFSGYTMAESFYAASRFVGWQDIIVGDPLCAPYREGAAGHDSAGSGR